MTAAEALTRALIDLADRGQRPPCGDALTHHQWTSEDAGDRAIAARDCRPCPILTECGAAADEQDEQFGVWAGVDRTPTAKRKRQRHDPRPQL